MTRILKSVFLCIFLVILLSFHTSHIYAATNNDFTISAVNTYKVIDSDSVRVMQNIALTNKKDFVYAPTYTITLRLKNMSDVSATNSKGTIPITVKESLNDTKIIQIEFPEKVVGIGKTNDFSLNFSTSDYVHKAGSIHTVSIPATSNVSDFEKYSVKVLTPAGFKSPSIVKPHVSFHTSQNEYTFSKEDIGTSGIFMLFGDKQYYFFKLSYNLENKNLFPVKTEIALPLNTSYQNTLLDTISPEPESVHTDEDGNYLATYVIPAKTAFAVKAHVLIESLFQPQKEELDETLRKYYVRPQKYWDSENELIKKAAVNLKTPEDIYNYVVKTLSYNDAKTDDKNERLGAAVTLSKPYFAVCLEFTDLFIALARSKGIPARAVEGYALTQNDPTRPASLFEDVLHAWPEYYDENKKTWIMVDPTWGDTTNGVDYFNTLDLDHVAFVRNGLNSSYPVPAGGYKIKTGVKDVIVSFVDPSEFKKVSNLKLTSSFSPFLEGSKIKGEITVINKGNGKDTPEDAHIFVDSRRVLSVKLPSTLPFGKNTVTVYASVPGYSLFTSLTNVTHTVTIQDKKGNILNKTTIRVFPLSIPIIIGGTIILGFIIIFAIAIKTRSLPFQK